MKKTTQIAAVIIAACIVFTATTQATARHLPETAVTISADDPRSVCDQSLLCGATIELRLPENTGSPRVYGTQELCGTLLAKDDTSDGNANPYVKRQTNGSPYIKRRGHGRSTWRDRAGAGDNSDVKDQEDEDFGDDSSVKFNRDLEDSSGYNEDL